MLLGCIADDLTGATDLAMILVREGMRTVQIVGVPTASTQLPDADAVVIALKSRTIPPQEAVSQSLACCRWLKEAGALQIFFKYCSTFDSTAEGNIGPVTDALLKELNCPYTIACPAFPENGRTVYQGNLFVHHQLLSESSLRHHPLTPMTDANLARVLGAQSTSNIENIFFEEVEKGESTIRTAFARHPTNQPTIFIPDAITDHHLKYIGAACENLQLITGGSAVAQGLPANFRKSGLLNLTQHRDQFSVPSGRSLILSGSCSEMTLTQVEQAKQCMPSLKIDAGDIAQGTAVAEQAIHFATNQRDPHIPVLIYSTAPSEEVGIAQSKFGKMEMGNLIEQTMGEIASALNHEGFNRIVVAGGETSGAVINALKIKTLSIGPEIDPGVPWTANTESNPIAIALKSGNFGGPDFFIKAIKMLDTDQMENADD